MRISALALVRYLLLLALACDSSGLSSAKSKLKIRVRQTSKISQQGPYKTTYRAAHKVKHHIYSVNASADAAWTSCCPEAFPPGAWTGSAPRAQAAEGSQLYGTTIAQRFIWAHQHPPDCSSARFLVYYPRVSGIGSLLHHMGQALALAIELDRVMVVGNVPGFLYNSDARCGVGTTFDACYFEPVSSCSWRNALDGADIGVDPTFISTPSEVLDPSWKTVAFRGNFNAPDYNPQAQSVPPQFHSMLRSSPIDWSKKHYWWRAQSVAYIVRPNTRTLAEIAERKRRVFTGQSIAPGTVSVHVRHGDKWVESPLIQDEAYLARAREVVGLGKGGRTTSVLPRRLFLSTEDPATVEFFSRQPGWLVQYTKVPRKPDPAKSTMTYVMNEIGGYEEMLNSLVNLDLALECDAFVGTLSSNWCRLIDELRATVRCKAHKPYLDAEQENPPQELNW